MSLFDTLLVLSLPFLNNWCYFFLFLFIFFACMPGFALFVPGVLVTVIAGFFARLDMLNFYYILIAVIAGAVAGDLVSYFIGRRFGHSFITRFGKYFFFKKRYYNRVRTFINCHTGKTLVFGRFNAVTNAFSPFIAGASKVGFPKFIFFTFVGSVVWALVYGGIGYFFGHSYKVAIKYFDGFLVAVVVLAIFAFFCFRFFKKRKKLMISF